jgi:hypothetical protein
MSLLETETNIKVETSPPPSESDTGWKSVLDFYFPRLLEFFYPYLHEKIDWTQGYQFLDKELQAITREAVVGKRCVDKLVRVNSCGGQQAVVLLHLEIQGQRQSHFAQRLFDYYCLLHLRYKQPIIVLAILTDDSPSWRSTRYQSIVWEQPVIHFSFYTNKLLDYRGQELILGENKNPFAWVVLAQLAAIETKQDSDARFQQKFSLVRRLYERDFSRDMVVVLFSFMDWVLTLPESLEIRYNEKIKKFEEEHGMTYITSIERHGIQQGECAMLERLLQRKFHQLPRQYLDRLRKADSETLLKWGDAILEAKSLEEIFKE